MSWRHGQAAGLLDLKRPPAKAVLMALAHHANEHTGQCWPDVDRLMQFTALSRRSVQGALRELEVAGVLKTLIGGRGRASLYTLILPGAEAVEQHSKGARPAGYRAPPAFKGAPPAPQQSSNNQNERTRAQGQPLPEGWWPDEQNYSAATKAFTTCDVKHETQLFIDASAKNGELYVNAIAAWKVWLRRGEAYAQRDAKRGASGGARAARGGDALRQAAARARSESGGG